MSVQRENAEGTPSAHSDGEDAGAEEVAVSLSARKADTRRMELGPETSTAIQTVHRHTEQHVPN